MRRSFLLGGQCELTASTLLYYCVEDVFGMNGVLPRLRGSSVSWCGRCLSGVGVRGIKPGPARMFRKKNAN